MDYYSHYKFLLNYYDKNTSLIITQYVFAKCIDCNDSWYDEYYECKCNKLRCIQHTYFNTVLINGKFRCNVCFNKQYDNITNLVRIFIKCICCNLRAEYGYKDMVCYCIYHTSFRKSIIFTTCFYEKCINTGTILSDYSIKCNNHSTLNDKVRYIENRIAILDINGFFLSALSKKCAFCNMKYINMNCKCKCKSYCNYCFYICVWKENSNYVCNDCYSTDNVGELNKPLIYMQCHIDNCFEDAKYGKYGILLYCNIHSKYDKLGYKCEMTNCYKLVVYKKRCYDHISEKIRKKIDYIIKN